MSKILYYTITLTTLSPVHIGSGTKIRKKDCLYMTDEKKVYILDSIKVFQGMKKNDLLRDYEKYLMDDSRKDFTDFILDYSISPDEYESWTAYTLPLDDIDDTTNAGNDSDSDEETDPDDIAAFIKDPYGCPYIPGSSLKGALRTAIQGCYIEKRRAQFKSTANGIVKEPDDGKTKYLDYLRDKNNSISQKLFFTLNKSKNPQSVLNDVFRGLRVGDSKPLSVSDLILCQKIDVKPDGTQNTLPIKRECIRPGTEITFELEIDRSLIQLGKEDIYKALDSFFGMYRKSFLSAFKKVETSEGQAGHLILLGGGAGFASKTTVYPLYDDREKAVSAVEKIMINTADPAKHSEDSKKYHVSPHIRKCTKYRNTLYDMGLCSVSISEKK